MKRLFIFPIMLIALIANSFQSAAQGTYYNNVDAEVVNNGLNCMPLKQALHDLISGHTVRDYYADLPDFICMYDVTGGGIIIDRYKNTSVTCTGSGLPASHNREHVLPKSWWGGSTSVTQFSDYHNLFPSHAGTNADKSAFPLGVVSNSFGGYPYGTFPMTDIGLDGLPCTNISAGTTFDDNVFEPDNGYKGDFARVYLYMAVRYQDEIINQSWKGINSTTTAVFSNDILTIYEPCLLSLMLQWHNQDPPSQLEIDRNNAIALASNQGNRNPFVDHPEYADLIWDATCIVTPPPSGLCQDVLNNCDWNAVSVVTNTGTQATWACNAATGTYDINAYTASNNPSEQWLVYGPLDMSTLTTANLVLDITENYSGPPLEFLWNATSGSPTAGGWNLVTTAGNASISGLTVNYAAATGNSSVYLGIKYTATGDAGGTHSFILSNLIYEYDCCASLDLAINFDGFPQQTSWDIIDANGATVASGGGYSSAQGNMIENSCLPDGCYTLNFYDSVNNGMCPFRATASSLGTFVTPGTLITPGSVVATLGTVVAPGLCGNYALTDANGNTLASGGGRFGSSESNNFCLSGGVASRTLPSVSKMYMSNETPKADLKLDIFPNVAYHKITLHYETAEPHQVAQFYVTDINGKVLEQYTRHSDVTQQMSIDVSSFHSGFYFVQMIVGDAVLSKKFVKM